MDNLQGVFNVENTKGASINLQAMESAKLNIKAPLSTVKICQIKSLHDSSYLECSSLDLTLPDDFADCHLYDLITNQFLGPDALKPEAPYRPQDQSAKPILFLKVHSGHIDIKVMSRFEILRRQIQEKMALRGSSTDDNSRPSRKT